MNPDYNQLHDLFKLIAPYVTSATGIMVFFIALRNFSLTRGHKILSTYSISSGINTKSYVHHLILENRKNKPEIISEIYLQLGHHYVVELKKYENKLLILKPMEAVQIYFDRVSFYAVNDQKLNLNQDLSNNKISKKIIVNTTRGVVKTKSNKESVFMIGRMFKNTYFACISPYRYKAGNIICSDEIKYVIQFNIDDKKRIFYIYKDGEIDPEFLGYNTIEDTTILDSKEKTKTYINQTIKESKNKHIILTEIIEVEKNDFFKDEDAVLPYYSYLKYLILGKIRSIIKDYEIKALNKKNLQHTQKSKISS